MRTIHKILTTTLLLLGLTACAPSELESLGLSTLSNNSGLEGISRLQNQNYGTLARQKLDIYKPINAKEPRPVIVFTYGGGFKAGSKDNYGFVAEAFSSLGYVTVIYDYRLYPQVTWPAYLEDGAQAIAWVNKEIIKYGGDPKRIIIAGHSAGAYIAAMLTVNPAYLRAANVPDGTIKAALTFSGAYDFWDDQQKANGGFIGADIQEVMGAAETAAQTQPIRYIQSNTNKTAAPFVMVHGSKDDLLNIAQAKSMKTKLETAKIPVTFLEYDMAHATTILAMGKSLRGLGSTFLDVRAELQKLGF
jgi:acetyl esterase/lipase